MDTQMVYLTVFHARLPFWRAGPCLTISVSTGLGTGPGPVNTQCLLNQIETPHLPDPSFSHLSSCPLSSLRSGRTFLALFGASLFCFVFPLGILSPLCFSLEPSPQPRFPGILRPVGPCFSAQPPAQFGPYLSWVSGASLQSLVWPRLPEGLPEAAFDLYCPAGWGFLSQ